MVGGARVVPAPNAQVVLDLQNGPDAVRLVWPDGVVEVVGYGAHEFAEYACGSPAADAPAGQALARIPDDADRGSNALDFRVAKPTPGRVNQPHRDVAWAERSLALEPERPPSGGGAMLSGTLLDAGAETAAAGSVSVTARARGADGELDVGGLVVAHELAFGESVQVAVPIAPLAAGRWLLVARLSLAGDEVPDDDADSIAVRVGDGPAEITEIQFHPASGEGEWVELLNRGDAPLDPAGFTLADRTGARGTPDSARAPCPPRAYAVLAKHRAALLLAYPRLDSLRVLEVRPWAALNNTDDESGTADAVVLRERDGVLSDRVDYSAAGVPAGVPIERVADGGWGPATDPRGSPLQPPRELAPLGRPFALTPRRVRGAAAAIRFAWSLPWPRARLRVDAYDLAGDHVACVAGEMAVVGRGEREWPVAGLAAGLYVLVMRARPEHGAGDLSGTDLLRVEGTAP